MKNLKFLLVIFLGSIVWNCANPELELDEHVLTLPEFQSLNYPSEFDVDKLLKVGYPAVLGNSVTYISMTTLGSKLLKLISKEKPYIYFEVNTDFADVGTMKMGFAGGGKIYYSPYTLEFPYRDELLFHEFVHILQNENQSPLKSRNNEIEAYLAQYLYAKNAGGSKGAMLINPAFSALIRYIADNYIDENTGMLRKGINQEKFNKLYNDALDILESLSGYQGEGWFSIRDTNTYYFPNIINLIKSNV